MPSWVTSRVLCQILSRSTFYAFTTNFRECSMSSRSRSALVHDNLCDFIVYIKFTTWQVHDWTLSLPICECRKDSHHCHTLETTSTIKATYPTGSAQDWRHWFRKCRTHLPGGTGSKEQAGWAETVHIRAGSQSSRNSRPTVLERTSSKVEICSCNALTKVVEAQAEAPKLLLQSTEEAQGDL